MKSNISVNKQRDSNIELLRIIVACFVIVLHYFFPKVFDVIQTLPNGSEKLSRIFIVGSFESISACAVNVFIIITGFFLCNNNKRTWDKPLKLIIFLILVRAVVFVFYSVIEPGAFSLLEFFYYSLPRNYFVPIYVALYLISPYINIVLDKLSTQERKRLVILLLCVFSLWNIGVDILSEIGEKNINSMSTVGRLGSSYGQTIVNFFVLYCIGAFIRLNQVKIKKRNSIFLFMAISFLVFVWFIIESKTKTVITDFSFCYYHNPFIIAQSALLFLFFKEVSIRSIIINELASAAYGCYILQGYILNFAKIDHVATFSIPVLLLHLLICIIVTYLLSYLVYKIYTIVVNAFIRGLKNKEITYFDLK